MKDLLKNYKKFSLALLAMLFLVFIATLFDSNSIFSSNKIGLAAVPMGWNVDKLRSEIRRFEQRYDRYYFEHSKDPNSAFMLKQEAAMEAMRARQYDLEFQEIFGYENPLPYNPRDYTAANFVSTGQPTQNVSYTPGENPFADNLAGNNTYEELFNNPENHMDPDLAAQMLGEGESQPYSVEGKNHEGEPWGGLVVSRIECTCEPPNYMVIMNDYVRNSQIFLKYEQGKSRAYMYWDLRPNSYGLGTMDMGGVCKIRIGQDCLNYQVTGIINSGPGFGSSAGSSGLSLPSGGIDFWDALGIDNPNAIPVGEGGTVPGTYTF